MTTYYVRKTGSNAAAGTSAGTAWQTVTKALSSGAGPTGGDTIYVGAGTYRETVQALLTVPTSNLSIIGDVDGVQTGDAGEIIITGYTTDDSTLPSGTVTLDINGKDFLVFQNLTIVGGTGSPCCVKDSVAAARGGQFTRCTFMQGGTGDAIQFTTKVDTVSNWLFDSCRFLGGGSGHLTITVPTSASSDYNTNCIIQNCLFVGNTNQVIRIRSSGANTFKGAGFTIQNCTSYSSTFIDVDGISTTNSVSNVFNCIINCGSAGALKAVTLGQLAEDYNVIHSGSPRTNINTGANSKSNFSKPDLIHFGQELVYGGMSRPFGMPIAGSTMLGYLNHAGAPSTDIYGVNKPSGGGSTLVGIGAYERHNTAAKETGTVHSGTNAINITGPGMHDFAVPVDAVSTTITIWGRYDTNHNTTNKPQVQILNGTECGVANTTLTMSVGIDTWEQLSTTFTPTQQGIITVRLISRAAANSGKAFFDDFSVS